MSWFSDFYEAFVVGIDFYFTAVQLLSDYLNDVEGHAKCVQ